MQCGLNDNLDLATLAAENGYSRAQFLRMFLAATGQTPHLYLGSSQRVRINNRGEILAHGFMMIKAGYVG
jgi:transcriptional regulator GlxA family with amidase domain